MILFRHCSHELDSAMCDLKSFLGFISLYFYLLFSKGIFSWKLTLYDDSSDDRIGWNKTYIVSSNKSRPIAFVTFFTSKRTSLNTYKKWLADNANCFESTTNVSQGVTYDGNVVEELKAEIEADIVKSLFLTQDDKS